MENGDGEETGSTDDMRARGVRNELERCHRDSAGLENMK